MSYISNTILQSKYISYNISLIFISKYLLDKEICKLKYIVSKV